jgi:hypothetical protein
MLLSTVYQTHNFTAWQWKAHRACASLGLVLVAIIGFVRIACEHHGFAHAIAR